MTPSLKYKEKDEKPEEILDYLARISHICPNEINGLFRKFEISTGFHAHQNLINEILEICGHESNQRIFSSLSIYQKLLQDFQSFTGSELNSAAPQGKWGNPVRLVGKRPIAALILMDKRYKDNEFDPIYVLSQLIIFAIHSDLEKTPDSLNKIKKAATEVRSLVESNNPLSLLSEFHKRIKNIYYINGLIELIKHDKTIRSNSKAITIFSAITQVLPLIPTNGVSHSNVSKSISLQDTADVTNTMFRSPTIIYPESSSSDEPEEGRLIYVTDNTDDTHNIDEEEIAIELTDNLPSSDLEELSASLKDIKLESEKYQTTKQPVIYLDTEFSLYSRNLHNPIERYWLRKALQEPEKFGADNITSLCISLSICTSINYLDLLDQSISDNGLITPDGYFCRSIPDIPKAIKPGEKTKKLYKEHINDQVHPYVYLPLPSVVRSQISKIPSSRLKESKSIRELFDSKNNEPAEKVKGFIKKLNKQYGQRFNTNRISCQLKQFIKAFENDPCITYALFGRPEQKAPTAFYYRSITLGRLISIYELLSERYFDEKEKQKP